MFSINELETFAGEKTGVLKYFWIFWKYLSLIEGMKKHIASVHEGLRPFKCSKCDSCFKDGSNLKRHFMSAHEGKKPHLCPICGVGFAQNTNLKSHIVKIHEIGKRSQRQIIKMWHCFKKNIESNFSSQIMQSIILTHDMDSPTTGHGTLMRILEVRN